MQYTYTPDNVVLYHTFYYIHICGNNIGTHNVNMHNISVNLWVVFEQVFSLWSGKEIDLENLEEWCGYQVIYCIVGSDFAHFY